MPLVTLRIESVDDTTEEMLSEYICDWPNCPNVAQHVLGGLREIRAVAIVCTDHAKVLASSVGHWRADPPGDL
jgi:hypothetical protein